MYLALITPPWFWRCPSSLKICIAQDSNSDLLIWHEDFPFSLPKGIRQVINQSWRPASSAPLAPSWCLATDDPTAIDHWLAMKDSMPRAQGLVRKLDWLGKLRDLLWTIPHWSTLSFSGVLSQHWPTYAHLLAAYARTCWSCWVPYPLEFIIFLFGGYIQYWLNFPSSINFE